MYQARELFRAFATNQNASAFTAKAYTRTKPSGNGVIQLGLDGGGGVVPERMRVFPVLLGSDGDVSSMRIWAWHRIRNGTFSEWFPEAIAEFTCTAGTSVGITGGAVLNTERFADTIAAVATVGEPTLAADVTRAGTVTVFSPANNTPAWIEMSTRGAELLEFDSDQTTGTSTFNALIQFLNCVE